MMPWSGYWSIYSILLQTKVGQGNLALLQLPFMPLYDEGKHSSHHACIGMVRISLFCAIGGIDWFRGDQAISIWKF